MTPADQLAAFMVSPLGKFRTWRTPAKENPQAEFLKAMGPSSAVLFRSGNRCGKSTVGAVASALLATGWHPFAKLMGVPWRELGRPTHGWISSLSWDFVRDVIWPTLEPMIPVGAILKISYRKGGAKKTPDVLLLRNGSTITFKTAEQGADKYQGAKLDWLWIDEEHPADVVEEARARLVDRGGLLFVTLTPIQRKRWVRDLEREPGTVEIRTSMFSAAEAGILPMPEVEAFAARLPERQRRVRVYGDQVALEGVVYPDFTRESHTALAQGGELVLGEHRWPWPLPASWPRRAAVDWGFVNPTAVLVAAQDPYHNRLIVERVYYSSGLRASRWARLLLERLPILRDSPAMDHDSFARAECEAEGLPSRAAQKDVMRGIEATERQFQPCGDGAPGLVLAIDPQLNDPILGRCDAEKLAWELEGYHYRAKRENAPDVKDEPVKKDDHACDALRYLVMDHCRGLAGPALPPSVRGNPDSVFAEPEEEEDMVSLIDRLRGGW